jgi:acyl-CoA synthetase (AMP-forming)/AMP-acid ligase II
MNTPQHSLLWQYVHHWAQQKPDAEAMVFNDRRVNPGASFKEKVDLTAAAFIELGVQRGDRIAMVAMACPEFLITFMAASKVGAIWLGLSPKFTLDELRYVLTHSQPKPAGHAALLRGHRPGPHGPHPRPRVPEHRERPRHRPGPAGGHGGGRPSTLT